MKKVILVLLATLVSGCSGYLHEHEYRWAEDVCAANGGITRVEVHSLPFHINASCMNGAKFHQTRQQYITYRDASRGPTDL